MEFALLGPFEARHDGAVVDVGKRRQERCLLGVLLLEAGRSVAVAKLVDLLWGGDPPASARGTVQTYVARLRRTLEPYGVRIATGHDGYLIESGEFTVDVTQFRRLAGEAREVHEPTRRLAILDRTLELWRGPLLADVADDALRGRLGAGLDEQRLTSLELRAESQLRLGLHDRVVAELAPVVQAAATRERLVGHLMTALYRSGRPADALELYRTTRLLLVDELGIEPGPDLRTLHEQVLRNDRALSVPEVAHYVVRVGGQVLPWSVGGHPALDFCNTFAGWGHDPPLPRSEWLRSYATLVVWSGHMGLVDERTAAALEQEAQRRPEAGDAVLVEVRALRGHLYAYLTNPDDHLSFRAVAAYAEAAARVSVFDIDDDGLGRWSLCPEAGLLTPVHAAARAAADLLADPRRLTVRGCPSPACGWLFIDGSGQRRWCSTATCGLAADASAPMRRR